MVYIISQGNLKFFRRHVYVFPYLSNPFKECVDILLWCFVWCYLQYVVDSTWCIFDEYIFCDLIIVCLVLCSCISWLLVIETKLKFQVIVYWLIYYTIPVPARGICIYF